MQVASTLWAAVRGHPQKGCLPPHTTAQQQLSLLAAALSGADPVGAEKLLEALLVEGTTAGMPESAVLQALEQALTSCTGLLQSPGVRWAIWGTFLRLPGLFTIAAAPPQLLKFADAWLAWPRTRVSTVSSPTHDRCRFLLGDKLLLHSLLPPLALHLLLELLARLQGSEEPIGSIPAIAVRLAQASGKIRLTLVTAHTRPALRQHSTCMEASAWVRPGRDPACCLQACCCPECGTQSVRVNDACSAEQPVGSKSDMVRCAGLGVSRDGAAPARTPAGLPHSRAGALPAAPGQGWRRGVQRPGWGAASRSV